MSRNRRRSFAGWSSCDTSESNRCSTMLDEQYLRTREFATLSVSGKRRSPRAPGTGLPPDIRRQLYGGCNSYIQRPRMVPGPRVLAIRSCIRDLCDAEPHTYDAMNVLAP